MADKTTAVAPRDDLPFKPETSTDLQTVEVNQLLRMAVDKDLDVEKLGKLVELSEKIQARHAASEFAEALATFQDQCPPIRKVRTVQIRKRDGATYSYDFAPLEEIAKVVAPLLRELGLSYSWDTEVDGGMLHCTCTLIHINGHSRSSRFSCPTDSVNPGMSPQQKVASASTFARRQSLVFVLGLTTVDPDTDTAPTDTITEAQMADLRALIDEVGADLDKFLKYMKAASVDQIRASDYAAAVAALEQKRRRG